MNTKAYKLNVSRRDTSYLLEEYGSLWYRYFEEPCKYCEIKMKIIENEILKRTGDLKND